VRWLYRYWPVVPLILLVVLAQNWVEDEPNAVLVEETINMQQTQSDYYLEDFTTRKFDIDGKLQYRVSGKNLLHFPDDDRSEITAPTVILLREGIRWNITSEQGELHRAPDTFTLKGDVQLERATQGENVLSITTEQLSVLTDTNEVLTNSPITVIGEGWTMSSVGLESNIDDGKLIFLSKVKGQYDAATTVVE